VRVGRIGAGGRGGSVDSVWAFLSVLAFDAVAIGLGLWTGTIRAYEGWFGVPWGNFFAWLFVAFWFSSFTRIVRARRAEGTARGWSRQWLVPFLAFGGLIATLVPFVAIENTSALPFVPDPAQKYNNSVWVIFALTLGLFVGVTWWALLKQRVPRERADHWLLLMRLVIHLLFLAALVFTGMYLGAPTLLVVALVMLAVELGLMWHWRHELRAETGRKRRLRLADPFLGAGDFGRVAADEVVHRLGGRQPGDS